MLVLIIGQPVNAHTAETLTVYQEDQLEISRIKSAYLYNFLKYIEFHPDSLLSHAEVLSVCVLGKDPFGIALDAMSGQEAKGLPVKTARITHISQAKLCHILYISESEEKYLENILPSLKNRSVLTVSDIKHFTLKGGVIGFIQSQQKIGIEINLKNADHAKIKISALLLEIAKIIE